jgi:hypothetical protein
LLLEQLRWPFRPVHGEPRLSGRSGQVLGKMSQR